MTPEQLSRRALNLHTRALREVYGGYWVVDLDLEAGIVILNRVEVAIERENCRIV